MWLKSSLRIRRQIVGLSLLALLFTGSSAMAGYYDDWWKCVEKCGAEDAGCVDSCTDDFNSSHSTPSRRDPARFQLQRNTGTRLVPQFFAARCPEGTELSPFPMPIYDDETGLFVIGFKTVWYCLSTELEPAG